MDFGLPAAGVPLELELPVFGVGLVSASLDHQSALAILSLYLACLRKLCFLELSCR